MTELLDIYDGNNQHLGVKERATVHRDGDWHRVFHCWVVRRDEQGVDWLLLQRRGAHKPTFPLHLDVTVGGHYQAGEVVQDGLREMREELGVTLPFSALIPCGRRKVQARWQGLIDHEIADTFVYVSERPLAEYPVMAPEVEDLVAVTLDDGLALFGGEQMSVPAQSASGSCAITLADFVPSRDGFFEEAFRLARRALNGERDLAQKLEYR